MCRLLLRIHSFECSYLTSLVGCCCCCCFKPVSKQNKPEQTAVVVVVVVVVVSFCCVGFGDETTTAPDLPSTASKATPFARRSHQMQLNFARIWFNTVVGGEGKEADPFLRPTFVH